MGRARIALVVMVVLVGAPVRADSPETRFDGELAQGDGRCQGLCDRYGLVWAQGAQVRVRLVTDGFPGNLHATTPMGPASSTIGTATELRLLASPGAPLYIWVNAAVDGARGHYRMDVSPPPTQFLPPPGGARSVSSESDEVIRDRVGSIMRDYRKSGPMLVGRLEQIPGLRFPARQGVCYRAAFVLAPGAQRTAPPAPDTIVQMEVRTGRMSRTAMETPRSTPRTIVLDQEVCAERTGTVEISFRDVARAQPVSNPGRGPFTLQLYERTGLYRY